MSELLTLSLLPKNITHVIHRHLSGKNYKREIKLEITEASVYEVQTPARTIPAITVILVQALFRPSLKIG